MAIRQEQIVLVVTVLLLGVFVWRSAPGEVRRSRKRSADGPEFVDLRAPDPALALPEARTAAVREGEGEAAPRDLFSQPRDTQPLPPLSFVDPPLPELSGLRPPGAPGPSPRHFGELLRASAAPEQVPGLFVEAEEDLSDDSLFDDELAGDGSLVGAMSELAGDSSKVALSPDERAALVDGWKKLYDWIRVDAGEPLFGRIANQDRFGLVHRSGEAIRFTQIDPRTGLERFPGMDPVTYERERVIEFRFADTASNFVQIQRREFVEDMRPGRYQDLLAFAERCIELRLEAREALEVAAEMFALAGANSQGDPAPTLGLARCYEAAFRFEEAYDVYLGLLDEFAHRAEVHVGLAELEARLRLFDSAEERLREAERIDRLSWRVQHAFGRFLHARGREDEALAHLELAYQVEPADPLASATRAAIRADLGRVQLAVGKPREAWASFERALQAAADTPAALAGKLASARLLDDEGYDIGAARADAEAAGIEAADFELLLSGGLAAVDAGEPADARDLLQQAVQADTLRSAEALGSLAWLAETSGYPEEAYRYVELAYESDPQDAWILFQRGRLLAARDDLAGAREAFVAALDLEIDFVDALVALGDLSRREEDLAAADLYLERALSIDPERAEVHALRGAILLQLGDLARAEESLRAALDVESDQPLAHAGLAWLAYRRGDAERSVRLFAELGDRRRALPETDPYRVFAKSQIERIQDHLSKEVWSDRFERRELRNAWLSEESAGPQAALVDGVLTLAGDFRENGTSRVFREYAAPDFISIEAMLSVPPDNNSRVGLFVAKERRRGAGQTEVQGIVAIARRKDGGVIARTEDRAAAEPQWVDVAPLEGQPWWRAGEPVRLRIERTGEGSAARGRVLIDGIPVLEGFPMRQLTSSTNALRVGFFVEGQTGLPASLQVDDVNVVYRVPTR